MNDLPPTQRFEQVGVWQKAHAWVLSVYRLTEQFPKHETYGLASQLRRAAVSIPANFAEGYKKRSRADKARFLNIAQGSLEESRYYLILAKDLGYADTMEMQSNLDEISRMLDAYVRRLLSPVS
ncbi:MAG TPA: four helix bundle protein [Tepidisphaeraceae bacterium]